MRSLYIHIPFCEQRCYYCDFCSYVRNDNIKSNYVDKLIDEIYSKGTGENLKSVFIGGGTPSSLHYLLIERIMTAVNKCFRLTNDSEITIESNPNSLSEDKLRAYRNCGINRLSIGVQTLNDDILKAIGRIHTSKQVCDIAPIVSKYFTNFNFDIMLGLPNQTSNDIVDAITKLNEFNPTHISMYSLILEENTNLYHKVKNNEIILPDSDEVVNRYNLGLSTLHDLGLERYEISNFSKAEYQSIHNLNYWECGEYYGVGLSAHSYINKERFYNTCNLQDYLSQTDFKPIYKEKLSAQEMIEERVMLGLRMTKGLNVVKLKNDLSYDIMLDKKDIIENLINNHFLQFNDDYLSICQDKFYVSNAIIEKLI